MRDGMLSVVVPAFNEADNISAMKQAVCQTLETAHIPFELIIVDDGSRDDTWQVICREAEGDVRVRGFRFSRNFGKEGAMFAGLDQANGACMTVFDADLQFPPETLAEMYALWQQGDVDVVEAHKTSRGKESLVYKAFTGVFYGSLKAMSGIDLADACDFRLLDRKVMDALRSMPERQTFFRGMSSWAGYRKTSVDFAVAPRNAGKSKFNVVKLVRLALSSIASFTSAPLQFATGVGGVSVCLGLVLAVLTACCRWSYRGIALGAAFAAAAVFGGLVLIALGILGFYLSRVYTELQNRPRYLISQTTEKGEDEGR